MADAMSSSFQFGDVVQGTGYGRVVIGEEDKQNAWFQTDQGQGSDEYSASDSRTKTTRRMHKDVRSQILEIGKPVKEKPYTFSLVSLELLSSYGKVLKTAMPMDENGSHANSRSPNTRGQKLSLEEIMRVAGERYIQFSTQKVDGLSMFIHPYSSELSQLSVEETADVELVQHLLAAAECISRGQFDVASGLITRCHLVANEEGNSVQRIVFHFAEALTQKIEIETGRTSLERILERAAYQRKLEVDFNVSFLACHREIPFNQAFQFAAVQAVVENVKTTRKIHVIDLHIRSGIQWTILMQALVERHDNPVLKISALEFEASNKQHLEDTGKRLQSFAESMNIPFSFSIVSVSDMFKKEPDEVVAVYSPLILRTMISTPDRLGSLIKAIRKLRPSVFVVIEVEANHNSPTFVSRFIESLFFYSAFFDCLEDCMERDSPHRKTIERIYLGEGIRNMVGTEGDQRCTRNVKLDVWRACFARYGMTELQLSESSLCQADMVLKKFPKANSCTLINNGKGVVVAWKGTPIHSLTTWKFL